ncbi:MAG: translocation protein TolB, partial [Candidatus Zixiibacteriota bacterium]
VDGTELQSITSDIVNSRGGASWSPEGDRIAFTSSKDSNDELYVVNIDGTGLRRLTENTTMDCCPDW